MACQQRLSKTQIHNHLPSRTICDEQLARLLTFPERPERTPLVPSQSFVSWRVGAPYSCPLSPSPSPRDKPLPTQFHCRPQSTAAIQFRCCRQSLSRGEGGQIHFADPPKGGWRTHIAPLPRPERVRERPSMDEHRRALTAATRVSPSPRLTARPSQGRVARALYPDTLANTKLLIHLLTP
jgi:hypothetical protein